MAVSQGHGAAWQPQDFCPSVAAQFGSKLRSLQLQLRRPAPERPVAHDHPLMNGSRHRRSGIRCLEQDEAGFIAHLQAVVLFTHHAGTRLGRHVQRYPQFLVGVEA